MTFKITYKQWAYRKRSLHWTTSCPSYREMEKVCWWRTQSRCCIHSQESFWQRIILAPAGEMTHRQFGIDGQLYARMKNYLSNRKQFTVINCRKSSNTQVRCGVPQGSVLSPTLFSLFTNDLPLSITSGGTFMCVDDTHKQLGRSYLNHWKDNTAELPGSHLVFVRYANSWRLSHLYGGHLNTSV